MPFKDIQLSNLFKKNNNNSNTTYDIITDNINTNQDISQDDNIDDNFNNSRQDNKKDHSNPKFGIHELNLVVFCVHLSLFLIILI